MKGTHGLVTSFGGKTPVIGRGAFVDPMVRLIGDIQIGEDASIWPLTVLRADAEYIRVGRGSAVLDTCMIEAPQGHPVIVEDGALISHRVVLHGCIVKTGALVGIGAVILDGAEVGEGAIVGASSVVTAGTVIPENSLVFGIPGKVVRQTSAQERDGVREQLQELYEKSREYLKILGDSKE